MGSDFQFDPDTGLPVSAPDQGFQFDPDTGLPVSSSAAQTQPQASAPAAQPDWWEDYWGPLKDHASQAYHDSLAGKPAAMPATDPVTAKGLLDGRQALQQEIFAGSDPDADGESKQAAALAATRLAKIDHVLGMMGNQNGELATGVAKPGDIIDSLTHDKLMASDRYRQVYESAAPVLGPEKAADYAKDTVAKDAHFIPYMGDSIFSDLLGAPKATAFDKNYRGEVPTGEPGFSSETSLDFGTGGGQLDTSGVDPALATVGHQIAEATPRMLAGGEASLIKFGANVAPALIGATGNIAGAQALEQELAPTVKQATAVQQEVGQESAEAKKAGETSPISRFVEAFGGALYQLPEYSIAPEIEGSQIAIAAVKALPASYSAAVDKFNELEPKVGYVQALAAAGLDGVLNEVAGSLPMGAGSLLKQVISGGATGVASNVVGTVGQNLILANHPELHQELDPEEVMRSGLTMAGLPAVMHVMHLPNAKLINDRLDESAMHAAATNDLAKFARISYVADQVESGRSSLWAAAELNNIDHAGQVRDETGFQLWVGAKKAARSAAEVEQPTAAETAPGEGEQTMEAAQAIVGSPNAPSTEIHPLPVPEQPLPPDEHPDAQVPAPSTTLGEDLRATVAPPQPTAVPDKQVEIDAAYAQRQQAEQRTRDEQLATAAPDLERLGLSEQDQRLEREHAAARAAGMEEEPPPTAMAAAFQTAKRIPRPEPPAPEPLVEGTVTGGEAPAATGGPTIEGFRPQAEEPSSTGFKLSDQAMAKGAEVPSKPSFRMAEPVGDNGIPTDLPVEKTDASDALERSINYHFTEPGEPQASFAEVRPDSVPHPLSEVLNAVQDFTGTKVSIIRDVGPKVTARWNGMTLREGTLYVNEGTNQPVVHILSHEWTHQLRQDAPHLYQQLEDEVNRQGWVDAYAKKFGLNKADALEELTADATGDAMGDHGFLDRMAKENPTVFGRVAAAFKNFLNKFVTKYPDLGSHNYMSDVAAFRDKLADVLHQRAAERAARGEAVGEPEARAAMTSETRGQNSWVNYGPHAEQNRKASGADTIYADQKIGILPDWAQNEGAGVEPPKPAFARAPAEENVAPHSAENEDGAPVKTVKSSIGNLHIETAAGQTRTGTGENGKPFSRVMKHDYGYIEGVPGRDGGSMDVLVAGNAGNPMLPVFVVHQKNNAGGFDEHKVIVGAQNLRDAQRAYLSEYPKGWDKMGQVEQLSAAGFKQWARTEGREQAQLGKVDASVPRVNIRGQQPDAVAAFGATDSPMPQRTANEDGRMDLPNAVKGIATRTVFDPAEDGGKHQAVLRNLYDVKADPRGLADMARDTLEAHGLPLDLPHMMNEYERLVIAHGFDGYKTSDGKATVLGAKVPMRATEEKTSGLATARTEPGAGRITERATENAGRDNAPRGEGETTNRAHGTEGDNQGANREEAGQGVRVPNEPAGAPAHQGVATERTSIKNEETEAIGAGPIERIGGKTADELEAGARRAILKNPDLGRTLAAEVSKSPRNISDHEAAVLAVDRQRIVQEHDAATKRAVEAIDANDETTAAAARVAMKLHEDDLETNRRATVHAGTEWSNSGRARQMFVEPDESFAGLLDARKAAAGKSVLSAGERAEIKAHADEIARLKAQVATPGLAEKPPMVAKAAKVKFDDALAQFKKIQSDKLMTKECYL